MDKLPRKEELLPKQEPKVSPLSSKGEESNAVKQAKEEADIATSQNKRVEMEIKTKLAQQGYENLEQALKDAARKTAEADKMLESASNIEATAIKLKEEAEVEKQKVVKAYAIVKERQAQADKRLEDAIKLEQELAQRKVEDEARKAELKDLINHQAIYLKPCRKALLNVSKAIYAWVELLQDGRIDYIPLYNYIGKIMTVIDRYIERTDIPPKPKTEED